MKAKKKSEWFELDKPLGEPNIAKNWKDSTYWIERVVENDGDIIWFGQETNWKKEPNGKWTYLGEDENVKPKVYIPGENGMGDYFEYPEGRIIWIECEEPIYEVLYRALNA